MNEPHVIDCVMDFGPVKGQSLHNQGKDQVDIHGFSWNVTQAGTGVGIGQKGQAQLSTFNFNKNVDSSSTALHKYCYQGTVFDKVKMTAFLASGDQQICLTCTMQEVVVASVNVNGSNSGGLTEDVALAYSDIEWEQTPFDPKGKKGASNKSGYKVKERLAR